MEGPRLHGRPVSPEEVMGELTAMRRFLAPIWEQCIKESYSHATVVENTERVSQYAAFFLVKAFGRGWYAAGGTPMTFNLKTCVYENNDDAGFRSAAGWAPHWWAAYGGWIADISADAVGGEPVILTTKNDARYASSFNQNEVMYSQKNSKDRIQSWDTHWLGHEAQRVLALRSR